jgi:hypothetical protein
MSNHSRNKSSAQNSNSNPANHQNPVGGSDSKDKHKRASLIEEHIEDHH